MKLKNPNKIEFICPICKTKERIPKEIVEMLDCVDQIGVDTSIPPKFDCLNCYGQMEPIFYIGVNGKKYFYNED